MTEQEKMLAGKIYDPSDKTLTELRTFTMIPLTPKKKNVKKF